MGCGGPGFASQRVTAIIVAQKGDRWCFKTSEQRRCARPPRYHQPSPRIVCVINPARKQAVASTTSTMDPQRVEQEKEENAQEMFDKSFDQLEPHDRQRVGGMVGGGLRGGELADPDRAPEPPAVKFNEDNPAPDQRKDE